MVMYEALYTVIQGARSSVYCLNLTFCQSLYALILSISIFATLQIQIDIERENVVTHTLTESIYNSLNEISLLGKWEQGHIVVQPEIFCNPFTLVIVAKYQKVPCTCS